MAMIKAKALAMCVCPVVAAPPTVLAVHPPARHAVARILHHAANRLDRHPEPASPPPATAAPAVALACGPPVGGGSGMSALAGGDDAGTSLTVALSTQNPGDGPTTATPISNAASTYAGGGSGGGPYRGSGGGGGGFSGGGSAPVPRGGPGPGAGGDVATGGPASESTAGFARGAGGTDPSRTTAAGRSTSHRSPPAGGDSVASLRPPPSAGAPEPEMWLFLAVGFGAVGTINRGTRTEARLE